jgi:hypothetical protein
MPGSSTWSKTDGHLPAAVLTLVALVLVVVVRVARRGLWLLLVAIIGALVVLPAAGDGTSRGWNMLNGWVVAACSPTVADMMHTWSDPLQGNHTDW